MCGDWRVTKKNEDRIPKRKKNARSHTHHGENKRIENNKRQSKDMCVPFILSGIFINVCVYEDEDGMKMVPVYVNVVRGARCCTFNFCTHVMCFKIDGDSVIL